MSGAGFDAKVGEVRDLIQSIGDEIQDTIHAEDDDGRQIGFLCNHGTWVYSVVGNPDWDYFYIQFEGSITSNLADLLDDESAREILGDVEETGGELLRSAALEILNSMTAQNKQELRYHLIKQLTSTDTSYNVQSSDQDAPVAFQVNRKAFPGDSTCGPTEFNHSVQTVISAGVNGLLLVSHAFDFEQLVDIYTTIDDDPEPPRYIQ